ncbi:hypothetical protein QJQ45_015423 [Haematococcus lacustris]|nr:hypothetical protein QJQ45_015423 [Haematococcus lacustris]
MRTASHQRSVTLRTSVERPSPLCPRTYRCVRGQLSSLVTCGGVVNPWTYVSRPCQLSGATLHRQGVDHARSLVIAASAGGPPDSSSSSSSGAGDQADALEKLLRSKVFSSGMVVREFNSLVDEMMLLTRMSTKFPDFDLAGKRMYVDKMTEAHERYKIFYNRLLLSDDPAAKEYLRTTDANMSSGGEPSHITLRDISSTSSGSSGSSSSSSCSTSSSSGSSCSTSSSSGSSSCNSKMQSSNSSLCKRERAST